MSHSSEAIQGVGFSTGALERGDFRVAIHWMVEHKIAAVELSALRFDELRPLVECLDSLPLHHFSYISFHAPSSFPEEREEEAIGLLKQVQTRGWNIIVHPDVIYNPDRWEGFGEQLLLENMDRRKSLGRTAQEMQCLFDVLPEARLCLDVAHARQIDTTLVNLWELTQRFADRIAEVHISELDSKCRHQPMSWGAVCDYQNIFQHRLPQAAIIVESMLDGDRRKERMTEFEFACRAMKIVPNYAESVGEVG